MDHEYGRSSQSPHLQAVLATLARCMPSTDPSLNQISPAPSFTGRRLHQKASAAISSEPSTTTPEDPRPAAIWQGRSGATPAILPQQIDPSTITTWQDGLRCVTKIAAQNASFAALIKRMILDQRAHEMRWYSERQALKLTQANRNNSTAQANSILATLNPAFVAPTSASHQSEKEKEAELARFDQKIYDAQVKMEEAMTAQLKGLGVPFFGTDKSLVVDGGENRGQTIVPEGEQRSSWSPKITFLHLLQLRRRMVEHLEDLYWD